jgi:hypothetical protein
MKKEGMHYLAYSLTLDPKEEILGAIEDAKSLPDSLDKIVEEEAKGIEVEKAPVQYSGNEVSYRIDTVPLSENYKDSGYRAENDDSDDAEVSYALDEAERTAAEAYEKEVEAKILNDKLKIGNVNMYKSAELAERAEIHKICQGAAMSFLMYAIKSATF